MFDRMRDSIFGKREEESIPIRVTETPGDLQRGDVIVFWDAGDAVVTVTLDCQEHAAGWQSAWRWLFLISGAMLEVIGGTTTIYEHSEVLGRDTVAFRRLTAPLEEDGVLQTFEARTRDGSVATDPVVFRMEAAAYRVLSTGTFLCERTGVLADDVWRDISTEERQNVYFRMQSTDGADVLGVWTSDIVLLRGRPLLSTEIKGLYGA